MAREMPQAGYYVLVKYPPDYEVIYTTGIAGKGGHKYWRPDWATLEDPSTWCTLLWSCVPGKKNIADYIYASTLNEAIDIIRKQKD
jgi:hypothetical protein